MVTDPIADLLIRIKNAGLAGRSEVRVPYSRLKAEIADILLKQGFIESVEKHGKKVKKELVIAIRYQSDGVPRIENVRRVSKPSQRRYVRVKDIHPVRYGKGITVLSTSYGLMTGAEAKEKGVGGEILFEMY